MVAPLLHVARHLLAAGGTSCMGCRGDIRKALHIYICIFSTHMFANTVYYCDKCYNTSHITESDIHAVTNGNSFVANNKTFNDDYNLLSS